MNSVKRNELISVVIPAFNRSRVLPETLDSVRLQSHSNFECIVVDDGSTDETEQIARQYGRIDARFRFKRRDREPKGASTCRNIGWRMARGDYVIFLDAGDLLSPECLRGRWKAIEENRDCDFWVFCTAEFHNRPGDRNILINVPTNDDPILRFLRMDVMWLAAGPVWRKTTLEKLEGWDERLLSWQDWDLSVRALIGRMTFRYFQTTDNFWRSMHDESIGRKSLSPEHLNSHVAVLNKTRDLLRQENKLIPYAHPLRVLYFWIATEWARIREFRKSIATWKETYTFSRNLPFHFRLIILSLLNLPLLHAAVYRMFARFNHSYVDLYGGTYRKVLDRTLPPEKTLTV